MLEVVDCDQGNDSRTGSDTRMLGTVYLRDEDHKGDWVFDRDHWD